MGRGCVNSLAQRGAERGAWNWRGATCKSRSTRRWRTCSILPRRNHDRVCPSLQLRDPDATAESVAPRGASRAVRSHRLRAIRPIDHRRRSSPQSQLWPTIPQLAQCKSCRVSRGEREGCTTSLRCSPLLPTSRISCLAMPTSRPYSPLAAHLARSFPPFAHPL